MATYVSLKSRLPEISRSLQLRVGQDIKGGAERIMEGAKSRNNDVTGETDASMSVSGGGAQYEVNVGAYYAKWVEFGRKNAPPYPFLVPAAEAEADSIVADVSATLKSL